MPTLILVAKDAAGDRRRRGTGMAASGTVLTATGLAAGGIPGVREPKGLEVFNVRGSSKKQRRAIKNKEAFPHADPRGNLSLVHPANLRHNARKVLPLPKAGILGFRSSVHQGMIDHIDEHGHAPDEPKPATAYDKGRLQGIHSAEKKVVHGMRVGRRATYGLTLGGAGLIAAGTHQRNKPSLAKRDSSRERGAAAGTAGATGGVLSGAYVGARTGSSASISLTDRAINRDYKIEHGHKPVLPKNPKGWKWRVSGTVNGKASFPRRMAAAERGLKGGALVGAATLGTGGYLASRGHKVNTAKRDQRVENTSAAALYGGGTAAAVGHVVPRGLKRFRNKYAGSAKHHVLEAQKHVPELGGLETLPAKYGAYGEVRRKAKQTMYPATRGAAVGHAIEHSKAPASSKHAAGLHRATATQERHFVEVFDNTNKVVRRLRGPGLAVAGAGAAGMWASNPKHQAQFGKSVQWGWQERKVSPVRTTEAAVGVGSLAWGASRLQMAGPALRSGARMAGQDESVADRALESVRRVTGHGSRELKRIPGAGSALAVIPSKMRPAAALAGGAALLAHAMPLHQSTFTPTRRF